MPSALYAHRKRLCATSHSPPSKQPNDYPRHTASTITLPLPSMPIPLKSSPTLPPHTPNPPCPPPHILPPHQPLNTPPLPCQLLITSHPMHKRMTRSTKPRHTTKPPLLVPAALQNFSVNLAWYEMVVRQRYPIPFADLARRSTFPRV